MTINTLFAALNTLRKQLLYMLDPELKERDKIKAEQDNKSINADSEFRINEAVSNKAHEIINDFIEAAPLIEAAGFRIRDLEVELSVIPKLVPHFEKVTDTDEITRIDILKQVEDKRIIRLLLKTLFKADNFQKTLKMGKLDFAGIEIEITAIPAVRLLYSNPNKLNINHKLENKLES